MKRGFYPKLALQGIRKNGKTYIPYILTCIGMIMMYYIISFLSCNRSVSAMKGGDSIQEMLSFGTGVIAVFTVIFLFYTNSFIIRRRKREFGLYNILGMGKLNIARILIWETFICFIVSVVIGLVCGVLFSKFAELFTIKMMNENVNFQFNIEWKSVINTIVLFAVVFGLILLNSLRQIHLSKPIELLHSDEAGEKPPKAHWILAVIGVIALGTAYYMSATIEEPMEAILLFFVAVILVIIATYILFIAGSVAFCRLLQKKKGYYYKTNHFVSVSSMAYRMKRNGASLASICILSTMVLVMISSTLCLFVGKEENLVSMYPREIEVSTYSTDEKYTESIHAAVDDVLEKNNLKAENTLTYQYLAVTGYLDRDTIYFDQSRFTNAQKTDYSKIKMLYIFTLDEYNRLMNTNEILNKNEVMICTEKSDYNPDTITIENLDTMNIVKKTDDFICKNIMNSAINGISSVFIFVPDKETLNTINKKQIELYGDNKSEVQDYYGFDLDCTDEEQIEISNQIVDKAVAVQQKEDTFPTVMTQSRAENRNDFYALFGGLFLLGILLSIVFICAAVLIMYYKQVSEGYEDCSRFEIMQKVGMTKKEIKKSINSQVLTVFAAPLLMAGLHIGFAFPIISKLLKLFGLFNTWLFIIVTIVCFVVFALFYIVVYRITSHSYYSIVSGAEKQ